MSFSRRQTDTMIVALLVDDLIGAINQAMRVRKITLTLDYSHKDHRPRLYVARPGVDKEVWMLTNTRTKVCAYCQLASPDLQLFTADVTERLAKLDAELCLTGGIRQRSAPEAKLQLTVVGALNTALTLARVRPGAVMLCEHFITPEGNVP